jgi:hypothetical protein
MSSETELSDLMVAAYTHQKNDEISLAIQAWNTLINHQAADKNLRANAHLSLGHLHQLQGNDDTHYQDYKQQRYSLYPVQWL